MDTNPPNLAKHLASVHGDGMALGRPLADNQAAHQHEHRGPGTIRNHDPADLSWDPDRLVQTVTEMIQMSQGGDAFYYPDAILADPHAHPIRRLYAEINIGVRDRGERWSKCANCGDPYQLTDTWTTEAVCSDRCVEAYAAYINNPDL